MNNRRIKLISGALKLDRRDIAEIVTLGGIETSNTRADSWLRGSEATKNATGNSECDGQQIRSRDMSDQELDAFCIGLKPWMQQRNDRDD